MAGGGSLTERIRRWGTPLLLVVIVLAYLPSLGGGFLNWDDPWLVEGNARLHRASRADVVASWTDMSFATRMEFGAEYLPIRDMSHMLESRLFGLAPQGLRLVNLLLYLGAIALLRRALIAVSREAWQAEIVVWLFALHPVHVESVAWVAGRKDVLALLFVAAAMDAYARRGRFHVAWTAAWLALAMLSKSMSLAAVALLPLFDVVASRRLGRWAVGVSAGVVLAMLPVHLAVGKTVGMATALAGGSHLSAVATMGPVWLRYVGCMLWPGQLSLVHDVPTRTSFDGISLAGYGMLAAWAAAGVVLWWRGRSCLVAVAWLAFVLPLAPVSQVIFPLQNRMADRYLWWSVLALGWLVAALWQRHRIAGGAVAVALVFVCGAGTAWRSDLFADSAAAFADATAKTSMSTTAPYQLGQAYEQRGDADAAIAAYEQTWGRYALLLRDYPLDAEREAEPARRATNNEAKLAARAGAWDEAERVLRRGLVRFSSDPKMVDNLNKVLAHRGASAWP